MGWRKGPPNGGAMMGPKPRPGESRTGTLHPESIGQARLTYQALTFIRRSIPGRPGL